MDCDYALYVTTGDSVFVALQNDARVTEVVAGLPASLRGRARFFYKRRLFVPLGQTEELESRCSDPHQAAHRLAYMDAVYHVRAAGGGLFTAVRSAFFSGRLCHGWLWVCLGRAVFAWTVLVRL